MPGAGMPPPITWLTAPPEGSGARGPSWLTPVQRAVLGLVLGCAALLAAAMIWPVLSAEGPARWIYLLHDRVLLPLHGRLIWRYWPWPAVLAAALAGGAVLVWLARRRLDRLHSAATRLALEKTVLLGVLERWVRWRGRPLHLHADAALAVDIGFARWLASRSAVDLSRLRRAVRADARLLAALPPAHRGRAEGAVLRDLARLSIAERMTGGSVETDHADLVALLPQDLQALAGAVLASSATCGPTVADHDRIWRSIPREAPDGDAALLDGLVWLALLQSLRCGDATLAEAAQEWLARLRFDAVLQRPGAARPGLLPQIDPAWWELSSALRPAEPTRFGAGPAARTVRDLRQMLQAGSP